VNVSGSAARLATAQRYLTFRLGDATYGIGILKVQEIIGLMHITQVPRVPDYVRGVINLRGRVIPVVDLRGRFRMSLTADTDRTCIVITQVDGAKGSVTMGVIVEDVAEVVDIPAELVEEVPDFGPGVTTEFLVGMGRLDEKVVLLLDIDSVLSTEDTALVVGLGNASDGQGTET
jgi:purine-binding chemotaxis protein CheW